MVESKHKIKSALKKLMIKNRLIIINEDTFEEIFSFQLNVMNVFIIASLGAIFLIIMTTFIIAFTPLREFIPGYSSTKLKREATELALQSDSLTLALKRNEAYIQSIQKVLTGQLEYAKFSKDSILAAAENQPSKAELEPTDAELQLRNEVAEQENIPKSNASKAKK